MSVKRLLNKPEYLFRPAQVLQRLRRKQPDAEGYAQTLLPWGYRLRYRADDVIGACVWRMGVYDLSVSEAIWRLLDEGEYAVDVGANIGHMTSVMAARVGEAGVVLAVEPHPDVYAELMANLRDWQSQANVVPVTARQIAFSDVMGTAILHTTAEFAANRGTASLNMPVSDTGPDGEAGEIPADNDLSGVQVPTTRLDESTDLSRPIALLKMDVEGHELAALRGGAKRLGSGDIRDIIFEEHAAYPTPVTRFLEQYGYRLFQIEKTIWGPILSTPDAASRERASRLSFEPPNYLATLDPARARQRMRGGFWKVLKTRNV